MRPDMPALLTFNVCYGTFSIYIYIFSCLLPFFQEGVHFMADEKVKVLMQQLEQGILDIMDSEKYKAYLKMQSQFHSYSFNNTLLILMQRPDATMVAGY